jgi:hypothetical protein
MKRLTYNMPFALTIIIGAQGGRHRGGSSNPSNCDLSEPA